MVFHLIACIYVLQCHMCVSSQEERCHIFHDCSIYTKLSHTYACSEYGQGDLHHAGCTELTAGMLVHVRVAWVFKDELSCSICFFVDFCLQPSLPVFLSNGIQGSSGPWSKRLGSFWLLSPMARHSAYHTPMHIRNMTEQHCTHTV